MLPASGNPEGFPGPGEYWNAGLVFETGHTNTSSSHHLSIDNKVTNPAILQWRVGIWRGPGESDETVIPRTAELVGRSGWASERERVEVADLLHPRA
jgi:hypothetical protein